MFERIVLIVLDSVGTRAMPDAADRGEAGRDTLGHISERRGRHVPDKVRRCLPGFYCVAVFARSPTLKSDPETILPTAETSSTSVSSMTPT